MIPLVDLRAQYEAHREEFDAAMAEVLARTSFIGGPDHKAFAQEFADFCGGGSVALLGNGTDALELALVEKLGRGDGTAEIVTASHTFIATAEAIERAGYIPRLVDVDPATCLMDLEAAAAAVGPQTKAIVPVHLYGQMVDMGRVMEIAAAHGLAVIEDAAQAHAAAFDGAGPGTLSDGASFSFYPGKNLGAWGDGGAFFSKDADLAARVAKRADHGRSDKYLHEFSAQNSRLDGLQAGILRVKLRHLPAWTARRRAIAARYDDLLAGENRIARVAVDPRAEAVYHLYVVRVAERDRVLAALKEAGVGAGVHYPVPVHEQPAFRHLGYAPDALPETSRAAREVLSLPIYPEMGDEAVETVVERLRAALG